jgi:imidazolonepropionase-like amidohydrolase
LSPEQELQRDRDGLAFISKQFARFGLSSVHHSGGNLFALQHVRADGKLLHRVSYEASGDILEAMIKTGIETGLDAGVPACAGSDFTAGALAPLMGIQGMVTRKGWNGEVWGENQKINVAEAIRIYTLNGAHCSFEEQLKGSITPGKLADYVMLAADPHTVDPNTIKDIKIVRTVTGGQVVYAA